MIGLESVGVATDTTTQGEFLACRWVCNMQGTFIALHGNAVRGDGTLRIAFEYDQTLEIVVACITKMSGSKAKVNGNRTTESAFVLQVIGPVFGTNLGLSNVGATATNELLRIEIVGIQFSVASCLTTKVGLVTLEAKIVRVPKTKV